MLLQDKFAHKAGCRTQLESMDNQQAGSFKMFNRLRFPYHANRGVFLVQTI